jgi:hypothetical protein
MIRIALIVLGHLEFAKCVLFLSRREEICPEADGVNMISD